METYSNLHVLTISTAGESFKNFSYIVYDQISKEGLLVDPSWEKEKICAALGAHDVKLRHVLLTHSHNDHINLSNFFTGSLGITALISMDEYAFYRPEIHHPQLFYANQTILFGSFTCKCLLTPGHTKGSACFWIGNTLFSGDTFFFEGCGSCDGRGSSPEEMFETIQYLKNMLYPGMQVFPGHSFGRMPGQKFADILRNNIYFNINSVEKFVQFRMRPGQDNLMNFH
ncbi:MAG: MBL fold metallo-hydrolase [Williamsia sp.]|nr:MBL fold metallo-hydrolase [Williamsia sp.]